MCTELALFLICRRLEDLNLDRVECEIFFSSNSVPDIDTTVIETGLEESQILVNRTPIISGLNDKLVIHFLSCILGNTTEFK